MAKCLELPETMYLRLSLEDVEWLKERASALRLRPAIYARMLLSKAVDFDRQEPGKVFTEAI